MCHVNIFVKLYEKNRKHFCSRKCSDGWEISNNRIANEPAPILGARWVPLTQGQFALVDEEDYERVVAINWQYTKTQNQRPAYASTRIYRINGTNTSKAIAMHRFIMHEPEYEVDHINMNGLDNRKCNLRLATKSQQRINQYKQQGTTSKYRGVCRARNKWVAGIKVNGSRYRLGTFDSEEEAARKYDEKARLLYGKFGRFNFPLHDEQSALRE